MIQKLDLVHRVTNTFELPFNLLGTAWLSRQGGLATRTHATIMELRHHAQARYRSMAGTWEGEWDLERI